jgi:glycosyltransferase involved in cell wall biosynthesis
MASEKGFGTTQAMRSTLFLGTDLPYFPGKNGNDFFNLRHLAKSHRVSVIGPKYEVLPEEGIANLKKTASACYLWPEPVTKGQVATEPIGRKILRFPFTLLPRRLLTKIWTRSVSIDKGPANAFHHLITLSILAPYLVAAIREQTPSTIVLIQSSSEPWMRFLPRFAAKFVYFHDIRADLEEKRQKLQRKPGDEVQIEALKLQEKRLLDSVDGAGFVSERDLEIAERLYAPTIPLFTAPIPIDTSYYALNSTPKIDNKKQVVLFTGHLGHPPNVDATIYFLSEIWPLVLKQVPDASFRCVGCFPDSGLIGAVKDASNAEIHPDVPDIRPFFEQASVYVVPMRFGGGVRQKILEAWSMKRPVVATSMAVEGINARHGYQLWLEDTPKNFAERVADILNGRLEINAIVERNRALIEKNYSIDVTATRFVGAVNATRQHAGRRPFKILFDLRWMQISRAGGIEQLVYELASAISKLDATNEYRFYGPRSTLLDWQFPESFKNKLFFSDNFDQRMRDLRFETVDVLAEATAAPRFMNREMRFLRFVNQLDFDLVHSFQGFSYPEFTGFPSVITIPDLQHITFPEFFSPAEFEIRDRLFRTSIEQASHVICISQFTLEEVRKFYDVPREKLSVVWITPSRSCRIPLPENEQRNILENLRIRFPFLLFPAQNWPHKNHERLLRAFLQARGQLPSNLKLVLTGGRGSPRIDLDAMISKMGLKSSVVHLGYVTPIQLRALYGAATALIFPSLFEGFGMPVAEAILSDCPVVCSNTTSLPEIAGDAALFFDPINVEEMSQTILRICTDDTIRERLKERAMERKAAFSSWLPAIQTISIYHRVIQERFS